METVPHPLEIEELRTDHEIALAALELIASGKSPRPAEDVAADALQRIYSLT